MWGLKMQVFDSQKVLAVGQTSGSGGWVKKNCVIDGNAIGLRWLSIVVERAKKNNERRAGAEGGNSNSEFSRAKKMCGSDKLTEMRISSLFAGNLLHLLVCK